jgi:tetratricopeptide (TPR) repeat protein
MGRFIIAFVLLAATGFPAAPLAQNASCTSAREMFRQHRWSDAEASFAECENSAPGRTDALLYRGKALINLGKFEDAAAALQNYAKLHPQSDDAAYLLAYISFRQDKPKDSLQQFTDAAKLKPPSANDLKIVALDYVLLNDYGDAAHYLELSLQMDPDDLEARYHLGRVRYQQNKFDLAIAAFQEVIGREPDNEKAQDNLGLSLEAENKNAQAIATYQKAIDLDKSSPSHSEQPYLNLGALLAKSNRLAEALPLLLRACEIAPNLARAHYELGKAYFNSNSFDLARAQVQEAVKLNPGDSSYHYLLGRVYQRLGDKHLAKEQFRLTAETLHAKDSSSTGMASGVNPH